jgi:hypothetical protein
MRHLWFALLVGCAAAPERSVSAPEERLECRFELPPLPPGVAELDLTLRVPGPDLVRAIEATALVGNALVSVPLGPGAGALRREHLQLAWDPQARVLRAVTPGKPLELALTLDASRKTPREELGRAVEDGVELRADGRPLAGTRLRLSGVP